MKDTNGPFFPDGFPQVATHAALPSPSVRRPGPPPALAPVPDLVALLRALRRHWFRAFALGIVAAALAGGTAWKLVPAPKYTASALIEVQTQSPVLLAETSRDRADYRIFQATQLALVKSRLVLAAALARPGIAGLETVRAQADPVDWLETQIEAEFQAGSELMRVSAAGDRPRDLAAIINAVADSYLDEILSKDHNERAAASAKLKALLDEYNDKLSRQRSQLRKLAESVGSDDKQTLAMKQQIAVQQLAQEQSEVLRVAGELKRSRVELAVLRSAAGRGDEPQSVDDVVIDDALARVPSFDRLRQQADDQAEKLARVRRLVRNENDPAVREARLRLDSLTQALRVKRAELTPKIVSQLRDVTGDRRAERLAELETQVKILSEYEKVLEQGVGRLEVEAQSFNRQTIDLQWMKDEIAQGEEVARHLGRQMESINVELKAPQRGRVVEPADNPRAESPKKRLAAIGLVVSGAFGLALLGVSWREYRLRRVDTPEEVVEGLSLRLVGTLPALPAPARRGHDLSTDGDDDTGAVRWQNLLVESVDAARTILLREGRDDETRAVMITSATKGEGKSSLASHLAISLARAGRRTVLVDFDLRSPALHRLFDVPRAPGVCELLRGENGVEETSLPLMADLDLIPAGDRDPAALRALALDALPALIRRLKILYEYVIIDTAPILPVADSLLIGQHADAVVLSVYRDVSRIPAVYAGYERLAGLGVRVLGVVVTGLPAEHYGEAYHYSEAAIQ